VSLGAGLVLALLAAVTLNIGFFVQHEATNTMVKLSLRHPLESARLLISNRQWMLGMPPVGSAGVSTSQR
jgi:hypothetical protein